MRMSTRLEHPDKHPDAGVVDRVGLQLSRLQREAMRLQRQLDALWAAGARRSAAFPGASGGALRAVVRHMLRQFTSAALASFPTGRSLGFKPFLDAE